MQYFLELCIKSVEKAIANLDAEIIVVDNNSSDESCQIVKQKFPHITLIENKENVGFSKANNQAVKQAEGEFVCILNPDTVVAEDTFTKTLDFAETKENLGIIGCRLVDGTGTFLPESKRNIPTIKIASQKLLGKSKHYYANHVSETDTAEVSVFVGAFMLMKTAVYKELKGFDEDFFMYGEDIDLSYRALKHNYKNFYFGETAIIHYKGESTLKDETYAKRFFGAMKIFYKKHFKSSVLFDAMVWFGIHFAKLFSRNSTSEKTKPESYLFYTLNADKNKNIKFPFQVEVVNSLESVSPNSEIIFDANSLSYKEIISKMNQFANQPNFTFKILPNDSNFIVGSNNSISRGEVFVVKN